MSRVSVLLTCFNRRESTLRCLKGLDEQRLPQEVVVSTYLTDDGSTDGTSAAVAREFPSVQVLAGDGSLFWTGGTNLSEAAALLSNPDYIMWLNDDVTLLPDAMSILIATSLAARDEAIVAGAVRDPLSKATTYGGHRQTSSKRPLQMRRVDPNGSMQDVDCMNGNVVLIPRRIRQVLGGLDPHLTHNMADFDYSFRAKGRGFRVVLASQHVGECSANHGKAAWNDPTVPLSQRVRHVVSVKGLPPPQWLRFTFRHCGWRWPIYFVSPYVRAAFCGVLRK